MRQRQALASVVLALALGAGGVAAPGQAFAGTATTAGAAPSAKVAVSYPFATDSPTQVDPWGAEMRQCTSFASWWLTAHGVRISRQTGIRGPLGSAALGNAAHWETAARQAGFTVSATPVAGAIAQWRAGERSTWTVPGGYTYIQAGPDGHVGVVRKVYPDGTALIQDYNGAVPLGAHLFRGRAPRYLLIHS